MTTYNTGNPLGSSDPRDLFDNAENLDNFANGAASTYQDRLGVTRKSMVGMQNAFDDFIESSGYTVPAAYTSGIVLSEYNQLVEYDSEFYKLKAGEAPYTTTGTWGTDSAKLVAVGDAALRQELTANANDFNLLPEIADYAALQAYTGDVTAYYVRCVATIFDGGAGVFRVDAADTTTADNGGTVLVDANGRRWKREFSGAVNVRWFGAVGDGVTDDTAAIQAAMAATDRLYFPTGTYRVTSPLDITCRTIFGPGKSSAGGLVPEAAASLFVDHTSGYGIKISLTNQIFKDIMVRGSTQRRETVNAALIGVLIEQPEDVAASGARGVLIQGVTSRDHGGHGFMASGNCYHLSLEKCTARNIRGHGFVVDDGSARGLLNADRPGQISMIDCRAFNIAGHAIKCGNPDDGYGVYRVIVDNFEGPSYSTEYYDASLFVKAASAYFIGENIVLTGNAFAGSLNGTPTISGLWIAGRANRVVAGRYISVANHAVIVGQDAAKTTEDITIDGILVGQDFNPANAGVFVETGARGVTVIQRNSDIITTPIDGDVTNAIVFTPTQIIASNVQSNNFTSSTATGEAPFSCTRANGLVGFRATRTGTGASVASFQAADGGARVATTSNSIIVKQTTVNIAVLPTSSAGLALGDLWNDAGTVKIKI